MFFTLFTLSLFCLSLPQDRSSRTAAPRSRRLSLAACSCLFLLDHRRPEPPLDCQAPLWHSVSSLSDRQAPHGLLLLDASLAIIYQLRRRTRLNDLPGVLQSNTMTSASPARQTIPTGSAVIP
ncbi:hypothetical protein J5N97_014403 [Dioscorea zingiberensis]|uniref:Secreted protein n=1 Tax=Dioscorea zingiberensis TaxID=325984 RepID=A0A9D5CU17_9LILI|nr:hypothetical protein J5N97_014403 [Dioscorea zingiberensis]